MSKSYRIRTEVGVDKYINVNLEQDWESLEILSLKILANNVYSRFCSTYGVVTGRVFVNGGYGLPNAKVSVFIPLEDTDELDPVISELYPFKTIGDTNEDGYRYNLLPKLPSYKGHASTGTFPNKSDVLMDESYIEVYDKYYRFTVTTNESGDFMIFGVPVGEQTIVMDVDLSDIGCFSMSPQDLIQQGLATESQVNGARFKSSTNLRELPQIKNLIYNIDVRPFWGAEDFCQVGITRADFDLTKLANITIQPSSVFMGSIITNTNDDALKVSCKPKNNTGNLCELITGPGEIQGIRQTIYSDSMGLPILERWDIEQGGKVIDGDGTFLVNVPMNLDYIYTNEFGEEVISNDPKKGIPTKGKYRFKFKWQAQQGLQGSFLRADFLVPNVKEHGWSTNITDPDPFLLNESTYNYPTIPAGFNSGATITASSSFGLINPVFYNLESYTIFINGINYFGSTESIQITNGDTFQIVATPIDPTQAINISFTSVPQDLFDVYKSYAFSTDWDDYADIQDAIDCEDSFYEFNYNKVYTTAMFFDRYKNGIGRAKHLGIKEIDDKSCRSNVNTFPVNDIIKNFDAIFFVFNILINILTFPILTLLFVAHLIAFMWPILKYVLIILGIVLTKNAIDDSQYTIQLGLAAVNSALMYASPGTILETARLLAQAGVFFVKAAFSVVLSLAFTAFAIYAAIKVKGFPRIGLPMISYPDCTSCECNCKDAPLDDDFDSNSITNELNQAAAAYQAGQENGSDVILSTPNSLIAPVNYAGSFDLEHPNLREINNEKPFWPCDTLVDLLTSNSPAITFDVIIRASLDFTRMASGYDVLSSTDPNRYIPNEAYLLKAPQPFLFYADRIGIIPPPFINRPDERYFAYPTSVTLSQRLNEFNTRDKYFYSSTANILNSGVNKIKTTVNPTLGSQPYFDQVMVVLMNQGSVSQLGIGELVTFQNPNYVNPNYTIPGNRLTNLTGATINQFQTNSITGTTLTGNTIPITINYANPSGPNAGSLPANIIISGQSLSELPVPGDTTVEQSYLQYPTDMEYFQLITGMTFTQFITLSNTGSTGTGFFPVSYLLHDMTCAVGIISDPDGTCGAPSLTFPNIIQKMNNHKNYEICIFVKGVDPHTVKQPEIQYDLSNIFGKSLGTGPIVSGSYYLNYPIQSLSTGIKPIQHDTVDNSTPNLYFPSFTFTPNASSWTAFTSNYPYYYLNTDDNSGVANASSYSPYPGVWATNQNSTILLTQTLASNSATNTYNLPINNTSYYMVGGTYMRWVNNVNNPPMLMFTGWPFSSPSCNQNCQIREYFNTGSTFYNGINAQRGNLTALYSPAYYRYTSLPGVSFSITNRIVMRSDRLPTSSQVQNGPAGTQTGYALHQNDNFAFYLANGVESSPITTAGFDLPSGEYQDLDPITSGLTETLTCEGMVPLECYSGSGTNVGVIPYGECSSCCEIQANRMVNGCYCLLNYKKTNIPFFKKLYLFPEYFRDARLFLEWKVRFSMNFAACRGIFAQVFQNNWINGSLYMFNFNKRTTFNALAEPIYNYCEDVIMFNKISNTFYYRSSPWDGNNFIGKKSPSEGIFGTDFPGGGYGYNKRQIQFPTTITDLGPRDSFINEVCCSSEDGGFGSYYADQIKTTSYQDNSDIVQLGFLSRILNEGVRQRIIPISVSDNNREGLGIIQFFNSDRGGYRIDGDWAQMLSINSEWKVSPFITENIPNNTYIFLGDNQNGTLNVIQSSDIKPILGLFFTSSTEELRYRKIMSPGIETYNVNPLIEQKFGYPKSQYVPHYKWLLKKPTTSAGTPNIFGSENNNWYTDVYSFGASGNGFFNKRYQDLDFTTPQEKYQTSLTKLGFISSFNLTGGTMPITSSSAILQGNPSSNPTQESTVKDGIVVGAPYHFYFGLNNGKTAVDRFYKLYVATEE